MQTLGLLVMCFELSLDYRLNWDTFLLLMATAFMIGTGIFVCSYIFSPVTEAIISKTIYVSALNFIV